jgi:hypothetical protein
MAARTSRCSEATKRGRLDKARQFAEAAEIIEAHVEGHDLTDAHITLCVHAGIAAADVLCCARLGEHAQGENHGEAIALLQRIDKSLAGDLKVLLDMKTVAGYSGLTSTPQKRKRAGRSMRRLVDAAVAEPR